MLPPNPNSRHTGRWKRGALSVQIESAQVLSLRPSAVNSNPTARSVSDEDDPAAPFADHGQALGPVVERQRATRGAHDLLAWQRDDGDADSRLVGAAADSGETSLQSQESELVIAPRRRCDGDCENRAAGVKDGV